MPIANSRRYRFTSPPLSPVKSLTDFSGLLNTRASDLVVGENELTQADNVRANVDGSLEKRKGYVQVGQQIGTATKILGLMNYTNKANTSTLIAAYNTDIYKYNTATTPYTIATTTNAQGLGYSKDRHVFMTVALSGGNPYCALLYQDGTGIKLRWDTSPYATWASTVTVDASTQIGFSGYIDASDNIHVAYMDTATSVKYVKLTYAAGAWTVGTKYAISFSGLNTVLPSIFVQTSGRIHVSGQTVSGGTYGIATNFSDDSGATWPNYFNLVTNSTSSKISSVNSHYGDTPLLVQINDGASGSYNSPVYYWFNTSNTTWTSIGSSPSSVIPGGAAPANMPDNMFTVVVNGPTQGDKKFYATNTSYNSGRSITTYGNGSSGTNMRVYDIASNNVQYRNIIAGVEDATSTSVTSSGTNAYPNVPEIMAAGATFTPVIWVAGTVSPYNIQISTNAPWVGITSNALTANLSIEGCYFPNTAAGGTDKFYTTNGTDAVYNYDGSTATAATASGYPKPKFILHYENRLWMGNYGATQNRMAYTNKGTDNFTGTFPASNTLDFPEQVIWAHVYRNRILLVFTRTQLYRIENFDYSGANVGPEVIRAIPESFGCISGRSVRQVGMWIYYQRPDGHIMRTNGEYAELISEKISGTIAGLNSAQFTNSAGGNLGFYYYLSVTSATGTINDTVIVLDTRKAGAVQYLSQGSSPAGGWSIDTGKNASCWVNIPDSNGIPTLYFGESTATKGNVYQAEIGTNDNGTAITMDARTGLIPFAESAFRVHLDIAILTAIASGNWNLTIGVATGQNSNSFTNFIRLLNPATANWGTGVWGSGVWGTKTHIEDKFGIHMRDRMFRLRFFNNGLDQPIKVLGIALIYDPIKDII